jgi:diguanylate cyclase (GGDEF)-like protein
MPTCLRPCLRLSLLLVAVLLAPALLAAPDRGPSPPKQISDSERNAQDLEAAIDQALRLAPEDFAAASAALDTIESENRAGASAEGQRRLQRARLQALAEAARAKDLQKALDELDWVDSAASRIDRLLLEAQLEELHGRGGRAAEKARAAVQLLREDCPAPSTLRVNVLRSQVASQAADVAGGLDQHPRCDYRALYRALRIVEREALSEGLIAQARSGALERLELARAAGDPYRTAQAWSALARLAVQDGEAENVVARYQARAREAAERSGDPALRISMLVNEAANAAMSGDAETALRRNRSALALSRSAGLTRVQSLLLNNIADAHLRLRQPRQALAAVREGLPLAIAAGLRPVEGALRTNEGLAKIALGRIAEGKRVLAEVESSLDSEGAAGERVSLLREFGEALAEAGDAAGALELYHRERALAASISEKNLEAALREIQQSFDAEVRQRDVALLQDQVATRDAELASQDLTLRIGLLLLAVLAILLLIAGLLYRRLRGRERILSARRERLRQESELDPLTGLGNRRAFSAHMAAQASAEGLSGALLLLDIDHFKAINDRYGHAAGDTVLVEVGRRLAAGLRREDVVVRWGGEEFLIHAHAVAAEQALLLARRTLERVMVEPVDTAVGALPVSMSLGLCMLRLHPQDSALPWEQALRLADLALYAAKSRGRGRAIALLGIASPGPEALRQVEADFEAAERSGTLQVLSVVAGSGG